MQGKGVRGKGCSVSFGQSARVNLSFSCERSDPFPVLLPVWFSFISVYLFLAALGLRCCPCALSSCGERGLLLVVVSGFSLRRLVLLQSSGSGCVGSVVVHGLSCPVACGVFLGQGWNLCPLHWQVDF